MLAALAGSEGVSCEVTEMVERDGRPTSRVQRSVCKIQPDSVILGRPCDMHEVATDHLSQFMQFSWQGQVTKLDSM